MPGQNNTSSRPPVVNEANKNEPEAAHSRKTLLEVLQKARGMGLEIPPREQDYGREVNFDFDESD